jgi:hypothetical protein
MVRKRLPLFFTVTFHGQPYETAQIHENLAKTRKPNLLPHKLGRYYARAFAGGKEVWKSLQDIALQRGRNEACRNSSRAFLA